MAKKTRKAVDSPSTVFEGHAVTVQQRKLLEKQEKEAKRAAEKEARRLERAEKREKNKTERRQVLLLVVALVALISIGVGMMLLSHGTFGRGPKWGTTYFIDETALPEKAEDGLTASINQVYYTKNGGLRINLTIANGMGMPQHPTRIRILLKNGNGEVITDTTLGNIPSSYYVIHDGFNTYEAFIPKQFIRIADDTLAKISYEITVSSVDEE